MLLLLLVTAAAIFGLMLWSWFESWKVVMFEYALNGARRQTKRRAANDRNETERERVSARMNNIGNILQHKPHINRNQIEDAEFNP